MTYICNVIGIIPPNVINNIGIKIEKAKYRKLKMIIDTLGTIKENKNNIEHIHMYREGWIDDISINDIVDKVKKGQLLAQIYSPLLFVAEQDYVTFLRQKNRMSLGSKRRLVALGISEQQISRIAKTGKAEELTDIIAPISGVISQLNAREGMYIAPDTNILSIVNIDTVWLSAEVFPEQISNIHMGDKMIANIAGSKET